MKKALEYLKIFVLSYLVGWIIGGILLRVCPNLCRKIYDKIICPYKNFTKEIINKSTEVLK